MRELRDRGTTYRSIANILNEEGYLPYKGKKFSESSVPSARQREREPAADAAGVLRVDYPSSRGTRPSYPVLAKLLSEGGFVTPRGNTHWWPAQVQQLLNGSYDQHYRRRSPTRPNNCGR